MTYEEAKKGMTKKPLPYPLDALDLANERIAELEAVADKLAEALNKLFLDKWCLDEDKEKRDEALALYDQFKGKP